MKRFITLGIIHSYFGFFSILFLLLGLKNYKLYVHSEQPIAFNHKIHVSELGLGCAFCHINVDRSTKAEIPPVEICISCHREIAVERPEIKKLLQYWEKKEPVPWIHIYSMPDYVFFTHKRHISAGIDCSECHGEVEYMKKMRRVSSLEMGWCVNCHRVRNAPTDCLICHK